MGLAAASLSEERSESSMHMRDRLVGSWPFEGAKLGFDSPRFDIRSMPRPPCTHARDQPCKPIAASRYLNFSAAAAILLIRLVTMFASSECAYCLTSPDLSLVGDTAAKSPDWFG